MTKYIYNVNTGGLFFEWDERKDLRNVRKHGPSFKEARSVFYDEGALLIHDPDHSDLENRFVLLGLSDRLRILAVCHTYRQGDRNIRIISARKASRTELCQYWRGRSE
jgi:uncharacterized DUF497 family protein